MFLHRSKNSSKSTNYLFPIFFLSLNNETVWFVCKKKKYNVVICLLNAIYSRDHHSLPHKDRPRDICLSQESSGQIFFRARSY